VALDELLYPLAADTEHCPNLLGADEMVHGKNHSLDATRHLTRGQCPRNTSHMTSAAEDDRWTSAHQNAAERLFGKTDGDVLTDAEDDACCAEADREVAAEAWYQGQEG